MRTKVSRRQLLGMGAATIAGAALSKATAHAMNQDAVGTAYRPSRGHNSQREGDRPYWERSYSGGPVERQTARASASRQRLYTGSGSQRRGFVF